MKKIFAGALGLFLMASSAYGGMAEAVKAYEKGDYAAALNEFTILARRGDPTAQNNLAVMYASGDVVKRDMKSAAKWYTLAAEQGLAIAQYNIGVLYEQGEGVEQDFGAAAVWYQIAGDQGDVLAQYRMGLLLANGKGVSINDVDAYFWLSLAAGGTNDEILRKDAIVKREEISKRMTKQQKVDAELLVGSWRTKKK